MSTVKPYPHQDKLGTQDKSGRTEASQPEQIPIHLPLVPTYASKGEPGRMYVAATADAKKLLGEGAFDVTSDYATHVTPLIVQSLAPNNSFVAYQRIVPDDAPDPATLRLSIEVLERQVPAYLRDDDGFYVTDANGAPQEDADADPISGVEFRWVIDTVNDGRPYGNATVMDGALVNGSIQSKRYPIYDFKAPYQGALCNGNGLNMYMPNAKSSTPADEGIISEIGARIARLQFFTTDESTGVRTTAETLLGGRTVEFSTKPDAYYSGTNTDYDATRAIIPAYTQLVGSAGVQPIYGPFGDMVIYQDNIDTVLQMMYDVEVAVSEYTTELDGDKYLMDFMNGRDVEGRPYYAVIVNSDMEVDEAITLNSSSVHYASGGGDGTMSAANFEKSVQYQFTNFGSLDIKYLDEARFPLSAVWDSGYDTDTKDALLMAMSLRKDIIVFLSTHQHSLGRQLTEAEESSMASALRASARLYQESSYFNTPACRAVVFQQSGKLVNPNGWTHYVPLSVDYAAKVASYAGAANGKLITANDPQRSPNNIVTLIAGETINAVWRPDTARDVDWNNAAVWAQAKDRFQFFYPAVQTVYDDSTSILNSIGNVLVSANLQRVGYWAWSELTGRDDLSDAELEDESDRLITEQTDGKYGTKVRVVPKTQVTKADNNRGYSWTTEIELYGNVMKTANTLYITSYRMEDLEQ